MNVPGLSRRGVRTALVVAFAAACLSGSALTVPAKAARYCAPVTATDEQGRSIDSSVTVVRGPVRCPTARRLARYLLSGEAPLRGHAPPTTNLYYVLGGGWRGFAHTGDWGLWKPGTRKLIQGHMF